MLQVDDKHLQLTLKKLQHWEPKKALGRCGGVIEREAKERCPVKTGDLRRSITFEVDKNECEVYTNKEYAPYVEYGTGIYNPESEADIPWRYQDAEGNWYTTYGQKAQPFMVPALYAKKDEVVKIIKEELDKC